jgi:hypothetical protein
MLPFSAPLLSSLILVPVAGYYILISVPFLDVASISRMEGVKGNEINAV